MRRLRIGTESFRIERLQESRSVFVRIAGTGAMNRISIRNEKNTLKVNLGRACQMSEYSDLQLLPYCPNQLNPLKAGDKAELS